MPAEIARQWNSLFSLHLLPGVRVHSGADPVAAADADAQGGASREDTDELPGQAVPGVLAALGHADPVAGPVDYSATLRALQSVGSMRDLLATLEEIATATAEFDALHAFARQSAPDDARLTTAFQVVATIGRGSRDLRDVFELNAHLQELPSHEPLAVVQYAARKIAGAEMEAEGLMAALRPSDTSGVPAELLAAAPTGVPAGPWQPPGNQPIPFYIGNQAHKAIAENYIALHLGEKVLANYMPIVRILGDDLVRNHAKTGAVANADLDKCPDITNLTTRELYEIKPWIAAAEAQARLGTYLAIFNAANVPMEPGSSIAPGTTGVLPAPAGHYRYYSPLPGIILYEYRKGDYKPVPEMKRDAHAPEGLWDLMKQKTGLDGWALVLVIIVIAGVAIALAPAEGIGALAGAAAL